MLSFIYLLFLFYLIVSVVDILPVGPTPVINSSLIFLQLTSTQNNCQRVPNSSEIIEQKICRMWTSHSSNSCVNSNFWLNIVIQCIRIVKNNISYIFNYFRAASGISIISKYVGPLVNKALFLFQQENYTCDVNNSKVWLWIIYLPLELF